jgi:hypothetical protein
MQVAEGDLVVSRISGHGRHEGELLGSANQVSITPSARPSASRMNSFPWRTSTASGSSISASSCTPSMIALLTASAEGYDHDMTTGPECLLQETKAKAPR